MGDAASALRQLGGIGAQTALKLARIGIVAPRDFLFHLPYKYQDRTRVTPIGALTAGDDALIVGGVESANVRHYGRRRSLVVRIADNSAALTVRFFHFSAAQHRQFNRGAWMRCYGEARANGGAMEMIHPEYRLYPQRPADDEIVERALTAVYPATEGVSANALRRWVGAALARELDASSDNLRECLPEELRAKFGLMPLVEALGIVHTPPPDADTGALLAGLHPAQRRLALEELLAHHLALSRLRAALKSHNAPKFDAIDASQGDKWQRLRDSLGFALTDAQVRAVGEIRADLKTDSPMMRLLQGDVGSGKTVVAAAAALCAIDSGYQVALMAPTELLCEQHRRTFDKWFAPLAIAVESLTGKMRSKPRAQTLARIESGAAQLIIGTHALFQQQVEFNNLGLLIIDEQHRFGVDQRLALRNKAGARGDDGADQSSDHPSNDNKVSDNKTSDNKSSDKKIGNKKHGASSSASNSASNDAKNSADNNATNNATKNALIPHQLIMSATPIPRSLAMIFYADLDVSNIDQMPPGRKPVHTVALPNTRRDEIIARIRDICADDQQAYWVCPLIEESDKLQAQAATEAFALLSAQLPQLHIALIHGRMKSADKEEVMRKFHDGEIDLLVATTVIEVGVDVPRASLMVIENAERLGLAQLHQLRGRVGRGAAQANCVLLYQPPLGATARERIGVLRETCDGFVIANKDLQQRGPGEVLGTRQTGIQQMKVADLARDRALLPVIESIAAELHANHPQAIDALIERWINVRQSYGEV